MFRISFSIASPSEYSCATRPDGLTQTPVGSMPFIRFRKRIHALAYSVPASRVAPIRADLQVAVGWLCLATHF